MVPFIKYTQDELEDFAARSCVDDPGHFARLDGFFLRLYQKGVIEAVCRSALEKQGRSFAVLFPRQSGKNELQAHIEAFLLYRLRIEGAEIVKISPTWKPQSQNAMRRLERVLRANSATKELWCKESGYIYSIGKARIYFLSGSPETNIVGATASTLLEVDEAQDVEIAKFDREIAPMAASTDATRVFWGTAWTSTTLLARELAAAQRADLGASLPGGPSAFVLTADDVAAEVPAYGAYVAREVKKLGRFHPHVRTQYYSEMIDGEGEMFPAARVQKMFCADSWDRKDAVYALLIDVAGEETPVEEDRAHEPAAAEDMTAGVTRGGILHQPTLWPISAELMGSASAERSGGRRDATALTVVAVDLSGLRNPDLRAPVYHPVARRVWVGTAHTVLYSEIRAIAAAYQARKIVVDATGVGAGLASFLERALPGKVVRFLFTAASKSKLGWDFLSLVDAGRWREEGGSNEYTSDECMGNSSTHHPYTHTSSLFVAQLSACQFEVLPGPQHTLRWGVPAAARDPLSGALIHDDLLISAALSTVLDKQDWRSSGGGRRKDAGIVQGKDPLEEMNGF